MVNRPVNKQAIAAHNYFRRAHGCPSLSYDSKLAKQAQKWADEIAKSENMRHSKADGYGENLAFKGSTGVATLSGNEATQMWYDEIGEHNFSGQFQHRTGHFTQVIWKGTKKAGFGIAGNKAKTKIYVVGRYLPAGNVQGQFTSNVPRPTKNVERLSVGPAAKGRHSRGKCTII